MNTTKDVNSQEFIDKSADRSRALGEANSALQWSARAYRGQVTYRHSTEFEKQLRAYESSQAEPLEKEAEQIRLLRLAADMYSEIAGVYREDVNIRTAKKLAEEAQKAVK